MVDNGHITGVIDWELGGFFPEYWEYVRAKFAAHHEDYWREVLLEVLECKYEDMVKLEDHLMGDHLWRKAWKEGRLPAGSVIKVCSTVLECNTCSLVQS